MTAASRNVSFDPHDILAGIRRWVEIETPTERGDQVNRLADIVIDGYAGMPVAIDRIPGSNGYGDHLVVKSNWGQDRPGILVLSHLDTVHPMGFIERLPFKVEGDSAFGPGIYDMKGGAYLAYAAFRQSCADGERPPLGITQLYVSDEEIGSPTSRSLIEAEGRKAKYVLVTEPARDGGKVVTGRKGVARFEIYVKGVAAHAGTRPQHQASGRPQRDPRARSYHRGTRSHERSQAGRDRQCRRRARRNQTERHRRRSLCRGRYARPDHRGR
jgi:glutamate carboxypeptidase